MSTLTIDSDDLWKQAAAHEGVDYDAVMKSFMDQAYGVVANKAKVLFQDPFRLGFEIVHRNEKATKMVGIFAFRVNKELLYAPVFFVNGEIKPADMIYHAGSKKFKPLSEDWCNYTVRGTAQQAGKTVSRNRRRQADAYMDRLAYPQRVKYASIASPYEIAQWVGETVSDELFREDPVGFAKEASDFLSDTIGLPQLPDEACALIENRSDFVSAVEAAAELDNDVKESCIQYVKQAAADGSIWRELMTHCADNSSMAPLIPRVIEEQGPEAMEKLAALIEDSYDAQRFLAENYTIEQLTTADKWLAKSASTTVDKEEGQIIFNSDPGMCKSASAREALMECGFELIDNRPDHATNIIVEEVGQGTVSELSACELADIVMHDNRKERGLLVRDGDYSFDCGNAPCPTSKRKPSHIYFPKGKELKRVSSGIPVFGEALASGTASIEVCDAQDLQRGKVYVALHLPSLTISDPYKIESISDDGDCKVIEVITRYDSSTRKIFYAPDRTRSEFPYISDDTKFLEVAVTRKEECGAFELKDTKVIMDANGLDNWMRTAGGLTTSTEVTITPKVEVGTFDVLRKTAGVTTEVLSDLNKLQAQLSLAVDFGVRCDMAGNMISDAEDKTVTYRIYDTMDKSAYVTRMEGMEDWVDSYDPNLQVKLDTPQRQVLTTHTPTRRKQYGRYGDTFQRGEAKNRDFYDDDGLPADAVFSKSPEELANLARQYDLPHIFDHGCLEQMATSTFSIIDQIKQYIPDLESGVDRLFRILFLLRYRPSDFEEAYGKSELLEMEQELSDVASQAGNNLLRMLKRFDVDQYTPQID